MPNPSSTLLLAGLALALVAAAHGGPVGPGWEARRPAAADPAGRPAPVPQRVHARASICRLRGGSSRIDIDDNCAIDPTRLAGVGIGLKKDKVGNHVVVSLAKGWPAAESCEIMTGDILLEVDEMPVAPLSTTALVQTMRGVEGSQVKLLLQRGEDADLFEVTLERVLQGIVDPADPPKKSYIESTIDMGLSMGGKATSILGLSGASKPPAPAPEKLGGVAGVGIGFSCDEEANFVVSKLVAGGPAALSKQIKPGDVLLSVDGMELDDMSIKELVKVLKGPVGTSVELHFSRGGEMLSIALTRNHAAAGASKSGSIAAGIFNTVSGLASTSMSSISSTAGGATAALTGTLSSVTSSLSSMSFSSKAKPSPADLVGVGLGIKKNQHGDFMIMDIPESGPASKCGKFAVGDILQKVDKTSVAGIKSAALRDLILGLPGSTVTLSLCRWMAESGEWQNYQVQLTRQKNKLRRQATATPAPATMVAAAAPAAAAAAAAALAPNRAAGAVGNRAKTPPAKLGVSAKTAARAGPAVAETAAATKAKAAAATGGDGRGTSPAPAPAAAAAAGAASAGSSKAPDVKRSAAAAGGGKASQAGATAAVGAPPASKPSPTSPSAKAAALAKKKAAAAAAAAAAAKAAAEAAEAEQAAADAAEEEAAVGDDATGDDDVC